MRRILTALLTAALLATLAGTSVSANSDRVTYGDVRAMFGTAEGGGAIAWQTGNLGAMTSAGSDVFVQAMRPFDWSPFQNNHYCELDWMLMAFASLASAESTGLPSLKAVREALLGQDVEFEVDRVPAGPVEATSVKRFLATFTDLGGPGVWRQWSVFYAPGTLEVGRHTLKAIVTDDPTYGDFQLKATFYVDAAGSGACQ